MAGTFYLKYRDTRAPLEVTLLEPDDSAHNLAGATSVTLHIRLKSGTVISRPMVIDSDPTTGIVRYTWLAADWDVADGDLVAGIHRMEYEVLGPDDERLTFPNAATLTSASTDRLLVTMDIGQAT